MRTLTRGPGRSATAAVAALAALAALALAGCGTKSPSAGSGGAGTPSSTATQATSPAAPTASASPTSGQGSSSGFDVLSMTFVSDTAGFALGTQHCGSGSCLALLKTTDGGATWTALTAPTRKAGAVYSTCPHGGPCVQQIRFATPLIGYAFGPSLFITTDGGHTWHRAGGSNVSSLEISGGTAVRVVSGGTGCAGQPYQVQAAPAGTTNWRTLGPPRILMICPPVLYYQGQRLVLAGYGNPAGGVRATAMLDRSADNGQTWVSGTDTCGGRDGYASSVALAPPDVLAELCQHQMPRPNGSYLPSYVRISTDGGTTWGPDELLPAPPAGFYRDQLAVGSAGTLLVVESGQRSSELLSSSDGGRSWATRLSVHGTTPLMLVGFEDPKTARVAQGDTVWTTTDGGRVWGADRFVSG